MTIFFDYIKIYFSSLIFLLPVIVDLFLLSVMAILFSLIGKCALFLIRAFINKCIFFLEKIKLIYSFIIVNLRYLIVQFLSIFIFTGLELSLEIQFIKSTFLTTWVKNVFLFLIVIFIFFKFYKLLRIQKIHNQKNWILCLYFTFIFSPVITYFWFVFEKAQNNIFINTWSLVLRIIVLIIGIIIFRLVPAKNKNEQENEWKFAPFSINKTYDEFNWEDDVKKDAINIINIDKYISVLLIDGKQGGGKSSYARMIIDEITKNQNINLLYTYISLTETNVDKDFSRLFLERCFDSLSERYPRINLSNLLTIIKEGLKDGGKGLSYLLVNIISNEIININNLKLKVRDPYFNEGKVKISKQVIEKFGDIEEVMEDLWIIMIDEIDRAQPNEIYRMIETMERFKNDGRTGLPVKIVFLLCVDRLKLFENLEKRQCPN